MLIYRENPSFISFVLYFISRFKMLRGFNDIFKGIFYFLLELVCNMTLIYF